ncbi:hypothetical protein ACFFQF_15955 [Haladaptatus pallidirubidus]|uniref:hypothetical protein n=1 Tax=Haladaptatus pallidirubidus TaxID=1008152 RepID=UPI0035EB6765
MTESTFTEEKAYAYVTRDREEVPELLVFEHPDPEGACRFRKGVSKTGNRRAKRSFGS